MDDTLDIADIFRALLRGWWRIAGAVVVGVIAGALVLWLVPRRWEARASVLVTREADPGSALLSQAGIPDGIAASVLGRGAGAQVETELELLRSSRLATEVADSLGLHVRVREPAGIAHSSVAHFTPARAFKRVRVTATREGAAWRLRGDSIDAVVRPGETVALRVGAFTLRDSAPAVFTVDLLDAEDAVRRVQDRTTVARAGGEIASVRVRWDDAPTSAALANALVERYLEWRRRTDRGDNALRYAFVAAQGDSIDAQLDAAVTALRAQQERAGASDAGTAAAQLLAELQVLRRQRAAITVERDVLAGLLESVARGDGGARQLSGFPSFLSSPGVGDRMSELTTLESRRLALLATRTAADPEVRGLDAAIANLEAQLVPMARTYAASLSAQLSRVSASADSVDRLLAAVPATGERFFGLQRDVQRLSAASLALQTQRLQLRLATIGEGGGARAVDVASPAKKSTWPPRALTLILGAVLGLLVGVVWALLPLARPRAG